MAKTVLNYGDQVQAPRAVAHPTKRGEFTTIYEQATVTGFSHPGLVKRDWGWRGDMCVEYRDGAKAWVSYA